MHACSRGCVSCGQTTSADARSSSAEKYFSSAYSSGKFFLNFRTAFNAAARHRTMRRGCGIRLLVLVGLHSLRAYVLRHSNEIDTHGIPFVYHTTSAAPLAIVCLPPSSAATWWSLALARGLGIRVAEYGEAEGSPQFHLPYRTSTDEWAHLAARSQRDVPAYMVVDPPHTRLLAAFLHQTRLSNATRQPSVTAFRAFVEAVIASDANELHKQQHLHCNLKSGMHGRYRYLRMDQLEDW